MGAKKDWFFCFLKGKIEAGFGRLGNAMSKNHDADKVRDGSTSDENDGSRGVVDGGEVPVSVEPAALNQVEICLF